MVERFTDWPAKHIMFFGAVGVAAISGAASQICTARLARTPTRHVTRASMALRPFLPWLIASLVPTVLGQVIGASVSAPWISGTAALFLPVMTILVGLKLNAPYWGEEQVHRDSEILIAASERNACLIAWTWGAGGISMLAVYLLSGLKWQHGWQYGSGMVLIAGLGYVYARSLGSRGSPMRRPQFLTAAALIAAAQGVAAIAGVMIIVMSGKVMSQRGDWAANIIFVAGGLTMTVLSAIAVRTWARLNPDGKGGLKGS